MGKRILFVCTGNTCRSPLAEGLLRLMAEQEGLDLEVRSAGVSAMEGEPVSPHSGNILREKGAKGSFYSKSVSRELMEWAELVLTMTVSHKRAVLQQYPKEVEKVYTLKEYAEDDPEVIQGLTSQEVLITELQLKMALGKPITDEDLEQLRKLEKAAPNYDVADPFGGSRREYERTAAEIEDYLRKLLVKLKREG